MPKPAHVPSEARSIERIPIDSSNIKSVGYSIDRQVLAVEFLSSGLILHYDGVPADVFEAFGTAESRGSFYAKQIKGKFTARPMTGLCPRCGFPGLIGERCTATILFPDSLPVDRASDVIDGPQCEGIVREVEKHRQP